MPKRTDNEVPVRVTGRVLDHSEKAYKFQAVDRTQYHWVPKSQCTWDATNGIMHMPMWMARDKGFAT